MKENKKLSWWASQIIDWVVPRLSIASQVRYARWMKEAHPEVYEHLRSKSVLANVGLSNREHAEVLGRSLVGSVVVGTGVDTEGFLVIEFSNYILRVNGQFELMGTDSIKKRPAPIQERVQ